MQPTQRRDQIKRFHHEIKERGREKEEKRVIVTFGRVSLREYAHAESDARRKPDRNRDSAVLVEFEKPPSPLSGTTRSRVGVIINVATIVYEKLLLRHDRER